VVMKLVLLAAVLALPASSAFADLGTAAETTAPAPDSKAKTELLNDVEAWRATQLPHVTPPAKLTTDFEPRLDEIKAAIKQAGADSELSQPRKDLEAWKKDLLSRKFAAAKAEGLTRGSLKQYSTEQSLQAEFSANLHAAVEQDAVQRSLAQLRERTSSGRQDPALFFDGARTWRGQLSDGPSVVSEESPADPKDPSRYSKVRQILISQGASARVVDLAIKEAMRQNADPLLVLSVINAESGFRTHATSSCGARGLMQIMPGTGRGLGVRDAGMLYDAQTNLKAGIRFLKSLCGQFASGEMNPFTSHGVKSAVAAYNAGPGAVRRYDGVPPYRETQGYVRNVLGYYARLKRYMTA
jgi:soluble lytic murein transglycosylase-like protein